VFFAACFSPCKLDYVIDTTKRKQIEKRKSNQQTLSQKRSRVPAVSKQEINKNRKNLSHLYNIRYDYYE